MHADMWATSLPCDLLLDIFRRLGSTAVIRCAAVCRPWRRTIIDNASCLRPRPDRFLPDLLLAFLDYDCHLRHDDTTLLGRQDDTTLAMDSAVDVGPYDIPLASRDGFLLLKVWDDTLRKSLCLCNLLDGSCRLLSIPAIDKCSYVFITAYDDDYDSGGGSADVRILAAKGEEKWVTYQMFSSGVWGPVKRSAKLIEDEEDEDHVRVDVFTQPRHAVVCGGVGGGSAVVYWLVGMLILLAKDEFEQGDYRTFLFAMDTRTERTWTTELPEEYMNMDSSWNQLMLATSEDGRQLSLIVSQWQGVRRHQIEVWMLAAGDSRRWTLQRTIDTQTGPLIIPNLPSWEQQMIWLRCFCPRSGYLVATVMDHWDPRRQFLIAVDGSSQRLMGSGSDTYVLPYEMDWSTYISKMKYL